MTTPFTSKARQQVINFINDIEGYYVRLPEHGKIFMSKELVKIVAPKKKQTVTERKSNPWLDHVSSVRAEYKAKGITLPQKEIIQHAKSTYLK